MGLNTYPYSPFPASTEQLHKGDNEQIQAQIDQLKSDLTDLSEEVTGDATVYPYADVITIEDAVPANVADCSVKIEPVQSGSGDPSPTNVRPITGHTEASVEVTDGDETTKTYTIALGDTIYGGNQNFNTGVCTSNNGLTEYNGDEEWSLNGTGTDTFYYQCATAISNTNRQAISNMFTRYGTTVFDTGVVGFCITNSGYVRVRTPQEMSLQDFKTLLANNPLQICYELATPTTIQLTPQQIQLLKGTNTLTASTGQISVTVNGVSGSIGAVQEQVNATDAALADLAAELAKQLPSAPTTDGAYVLTVTVADGTPTYSWESAE